MDPQSAPEPPPRPPSAGAPAVPRSPGWKEAALRVVIVATLAYSTYYIVWRWTRTLNTDALWFSVPLVLAETWGLLAGFLFGFATWRLQQRDVRPPARGLSVDVFITTYDEPLDVIRRTARAAVAITYPHETYVLDDGARPTVRAMAAELGLRYLARESRVKAKAGNLNYGLAHSDGEFILMLDADHVPLPGILDRMLGFFDDERVAFVQAPQDFYNTDSFTHDVDQRARRIWEEQRLFFQVIQPGKDTWNAAFFCGSCAVLRRSALEEIGGVADRTIVEDIETSIRLHARSWKSVYCGESVAFGLAAGSATAFHTQQLRWGTGAMHVLRRYNPLTLPGLTAAQRLSYLDSLTTYFGGIQKLVFYTAPLVFLFTGILPIRHLDVQFLSRFVPYLLLTILMFELVARGTGYVMMTERFGMAKFLTHTRATLVGLFGRMNGAFAVTPKGKVNVRLLTYFPQLAIIVLTFAGILWGSAAFLGSGIPGPDPGDRTAFAVNLLWAAWHLTLAWYVVQVSRKHQQRAEYRFGERLPAVVRTPEGLEYAVITDVHTGGLGMNMVRPLNTGTQVAAELPLYSGATTVHGHVVRRQRVVTPVGPVFAHGLEFDEWDAAVTSALEAHYTRGISTAAARGYRAGADLYHRTAEWFRPASSELQRVHLPVLLRVASSEAAIDKTQDVELRQVAVLEEIGPRTVRIVAPSPITTGTELEYRIAGSSQVGYGRVVFCRAVETPSLVRFVIGLDRGEDSDPDAAASGERANTQVTP